MPSIKTSYALVITNDVQRIGQNMFNFLEWLHTNKGLSNNQAPRMADPFHINDEDLIKYWKEYQRLGGED